MADHKYKKDDVIHNGKGKYLGTVIKLDKTPDNKNKYGLMTPTGEIELLENQIIKPK